MAEAQEALQLVLRELHLIKEENAALRRDMSSGIQRLENQMSSMQREAHRMKPDLAMASSKRLEAMLEGTNVGGGQLVGRGSSSVMNIDYQSPRQSELAVISQMLSSQCGKGPQAIAESMEALPSSGARQGLSTGDGGVQNGRSSLERSRSAMGASKGLQKRPTNVDATSFFQTNFGSPEKGLDRSIDDLEDDDDQVAAPRNGKEMVKAIFMTPIHPLSPFRTRWDLFVLLLLVYVCVTAPVIVCFNVEIEMGEQDIWYFEQIVTIMFVIDIILNFNTAYLKPDDTLVTSRAEIALRYAKTWLLVDFIAVIPYELITPSQEAEVAQLAKGLRLAKFTRILRVLRVIKLLRILKVPALLRRIEGVTGRGALRSFLILGGAILICHLAACGFFFAAQLKMQDQFSAYVQAEVDARFPEPWGYEDMPEEMKEHYREVSWEGTWVYGADLQARGTVSRYITALYWSMSTLTTVGYGDVTPANNAEKIVSMVAMVLGVTIFAYFMGSSASLIAAMNSGETMVTRKLAQMDDFLRQRRVPRELTDKVRKFYSLAVQHQVVEDDHMVNQLSLPLRTELLLFLYRETLERVPFFKGQDPQFITSLVAKLHMEYYAEGDIVVQEGDLGNIMYFVVSGVLEARQYNFDRECVPPMKSSLDTTQRPSATVQALRNFTKKLRRNKVSAEIEEEYSQIPQQWKFFSNVRDLKLNFNRIGRLHIGEHFGEYSCLLGHPRTSTVVALDFSELYSLSRDDLMEVYRQWPELHKEFLDLVKQFQEITGITPIGLELDEDDDITESMREGTDQEASIHDPLIPRRDTVATEINAAVANFRSSEVSTCSVTESEGVESSHDSERTKGRKGMKKAVKLMMNMKQFDKLSTNPVFKLLNNGHDLKGMMESDVYEHGHDDLPPLKEDGASVSRPRAKSMFYAEDPEDFKMKGSFHKSATIANNATRHDDTDPESPPLKAGFDPAQDPHRPGEQ